MLQVHYLLTAMGSQTGHVLFLRMNITQETFDSYVKENIDELGKT